MENWAFAPEVLATYARHWQTGEPIPAALVEKIEQTQRFNQGFKSVEYLAASYLDMEWHTLAAAAAPDTDTLERIALARIGMPREIVMRHRSSYFGHIRRRRRLLGGYYSYIWAECSTPTPSRRSAKRFDPETARAFRTEVLEKGGSEDAMTMFVRFRGREPSVAPLLVKRGLDL